MWIASALLTELRIEFPVRSAIAVFLAVAGLVVVALGVISFRQAKTTVNPMKPDSASSLVVGGIYRITRNPMYLGFLLVLLGWAVFLSNLFAYALVPVFVIYMHRFQIAPEERSLEKLFGTEFRAYKAKVRRWL